MSTTAHDPNLGFEHAPGLIRLARRLAGAADAEDLVQSTYARALEHHDVVRSRKSWLRQVMLNERKMDLRAKQRRGDRERSAGDLGEPTRHLEDIVHTRDVARVVKDLVEQLEDDVRLVVHQRYFAGQSAADIARRHCIPAGTVRWRLKVGLDRLRTQLDAHYGGSRALWAGGLCPGLVKPTVPTTAASELATVGGTTTTAAGKGTSVMSSIISAKILWVAGATVAATVGGVTWMGAEDVSAPAERVQAAGDAPQVAAPSVQAAKTPSSAEAAASSPAHEGTRRLWEQRRSAIQAVHAMQRRTSAPAKFEDDGAVEQRCEGSCDRDRTHCIRLGEPGQRAEQGEGSCDIGMCTDDGCLEALAREVTEMAGGCDEFKSGAPKDLVVRANVIGAPDVGSIVEGVELATEHAVPDDLRECLTEQMYALDLGPTDVNFEQSITVLFGRETLDIKDIADVVDVDDATRAEIEEAIANGGERVKVIHLEGDDPAPER
jgi:RNA polymerase sigma-70 factor (ECF subfamily)